MFSKHILSFIILGFCLAATICYACPEFLDPSDSDLNCVGYGSPCNDTDINQAACYIDFSCYNGTCQCPHPEASIYDAMSLEPCIIKAGERCIDKIQSYNGRTGFQTIIKEFFCDYYAKCLPPGVCSCLPGLHMVDDGTCVGQGDIGETCNSDVDCNSEKYLTCGEMYGRKICICPNNPDPSNIRYECATSLRRNCSIDGVKCIRNANCVDGTCECKSGYKRSLTGFCQNGFSNFNETCETDDDCHSDNNGFALICNSNGRCDCSGSRPVFSKRDGYQRGGVCVQVFGGKCYSDGDCDKNFECNGRSGRCLCKDLYSVNYDGNCERNL